MNEIAAFQAALAAYAQVRKQQETAQQQLETATDPINLESLFVVVRDFVRVLTTVPEQPLWQANALEAITDSMAVFDAQHIPLPDASEYLTALQWGLSVIAHQFSRHGLGNILQ